MRKIFTITIFTFISIGLSAQFNLFQSKPKGLYLQELQTGKFKSLELDSPNLNALQIEDVTRDHQGEFYRIGVSVGTSFNLFEKGNWQQLSDGSKICRLKINAAGAKGIGVYYKQLKLSPGCFLSVYSIENGRIAAVHDSNENNDGTEYATPPIEGENLVIEYYQPANAQSSTVIIDYFSYIYRGLESIKINTKDFGDSDPCQVNVNCNPEGTDWQDEKRAVVRILLTDGSSQGWCTGALINNTAEDCKNYILTAQLCGAGASAANFNQWIFYFNYESPNCANPSAQGTLASQTRTGASKKSSSGTTSNVTKSDFLLVELNTTIPTNYNPYYAGWNRSTTASTGGKGIHHPSGDIKKISTFTGTAVSTSWNGHAPANSHWRVTWVATANGHGVTEGGSSGSPLFDNNGRIIGDLSGGSSYCSSPTNPDSYGNFSYSWDQAGTTAATRLKDWLDPSNSGVTTLNGKNACSATPPPVGGCDTIGNYNLAIHTPSQYTPNAIGSSGTGFVAGNNSYGDKAKAERFANTYPAGSTVKGAFLAFFNATGTGTATLAIWDNTGTGGAPGTIQRQQTVNISNIPTNGNSVFWDLSANPYTITGNFYVGVILPTGTGQSVALYTTAVGEVNPGTAWEQFSDNTWHAYSETGVSWGINVTHAIFPIVCTPSGTVLAPVADFIANPTTANINQTVAFTNQSTNNPTSYSWSFSPATMTYVNGTNSTSVNPQVQFTAAGNYTVSLTAANSAGSNTKTKTAYIKVNANTSIEEGKLQSIRIFPNPVNDYLSIELPENEIINLKIVDLFGKVVFAQSIENGLTKIHLLYLSSMNTGMYVLEVTDKLNNKRV
jgi:PKD repeat protein